MLNHRDIPTHVWARTHHLIGPLALSLVVGATACQGSSGDELPPADDGGAHDSGEHDSGELDGGAHASGEHDSGELDGGALEHEDAGDGGPVISDTLSLTRYCEEGAEVYFDYLQRCYGPDHYNDEERATYMEKTRARCLHVQSALDAGRMSYDEEQGAACLTALRGLDCASEFVAEACAAVFRGHVPIGEDCYRQESLVMLVGTSACAEGICVEDNACPGTCQAFPARGDDCLQGQCAPADYCDGESKCSARTGPGATCIDELSCAKGLGCAGAPGTRVCAQKVTREGLACDTTTACGGLTTCLEGACRYERSMGEPCVVDHQCPEGGICVGAICTAQGDLGAPCTGDRACKSALVCDTSSDEPTCIALPGDGELCVHNRCAEGTSCTFGPDEQEGTCRTLVAQGGACLVYNTPTDSRCASGLYCVEAGTCQPPGGLDEPCGVFSSESCAEGLWCSRETHTCQAPVAQGEACNPYWLNTCASGLGCDCGVEDASLCGSYPREHQATDTCQPLVAIDGACFRSSECASGTCIVDVASPSVPGKCVGETPVCLP
jgi:hypothetical protein